MGFVQIEPAPTDILNFFLIILTFFTGMRLAIFKNIYCWLPIIILMFGFSIVPAAPNDHLRFYLIDIYLSLFFFCLVSVIKTEQDLKKLIETYAKSTLLYTILTLFLYFSGNTEVTKYGRLCGFFKDPNVFGPFLILPFLYYYNALVKELRIIHIVAVLTFLIAIVLSGSRGAWINLATAICFLMAFSKHKNFKYRLKSLFIPSIFAAFALGFLFTTNSEEILDKLSSRLALQSYDSDRWNAFVTSINLSILNPFGVGAGNADQFVGMAVHNTFLRLILERGFLIILFLVAWLFESRLRLSLCQKPSSGIIIASIVGLVVNSLVVDTLHWRHAWLLFGLFVSDNLLRNSSNEYST